MLLIDVLGLGNASKYTKSIAQSDTGKPEHNHDTNSLRLWGGEQFVEHIIRLIWRSRRCISSELGEIIPEANGYESDLSGLSFRYLRNIYWTSVNGRGDIKRTP